MEPRVTFWAWGHFWGLGSLYSYSWSCWHTGAGFGAISSLPIPRHCSSSSLHGHPNNPVMSSGEPGTAHSPSSHTSHGTSPLHQVDSSGTFVQLRLNLAQTACRKQTQKRQNCRIMENRVRWGLHPSSQRPISRHGDRVVSPLLPPSCPVAVCPSCPARLLVLGVVRKPCCRAVGDVPRAGGGVWVLALVAMAVLSLQRKPVCLACYKFDNSDVPKVLDKYYNCGPSHHLAVKVSSPQGGLSSETSSGSPQ